MLNRSDYPAGVPCWIDSLQPDPQAATRFYGGLFGWEFEDRVPAGVPGHYFIASLDGGVVGAIGSEPDSEPPPSRPPGARTSPSTAPTRPPTASGAPAAASSPSRSTSSMRVAWRCSPIRRAPCSPSGSPGSARAPRSSTRPARGTGATSTRAIPRARGTSTPRSSAGSPPTSASGSRTATMWRRPGYADALEQIDPGIRERHAEGDAPEGFSDAIGWMMDMWRPVRRRRPAALGRDVRGRRHRRGGSARRGARRHGRRRAVRRGTDARGGRERPAGRDVLDQHLRAKHVVVSPQAG